MSRAPGAGRVWRDLATGTPEGPAARDLTARHARDLRKGRESVPGRVYALTKCTAGRAAVFDPSSNLGAEAARAVAEALRHREALGRWKVEGFLLMPDHLHAVVRLGRADLSAEVGALCAFTARRINALLGRTGPFWQEGFYDHAIRGPKTLEAYLAYVATNPVRAGLAACASDWPFRSGVL